MPSVSKKQHNLMAAVAHNPAFAKKVGISQSVGKDFSEADKNRKFNKGGDMKSSKEMKAAGIFAKAGEKKLAAHERREAMGKEKDTPAIAKKEMSVLKKAKAPKDVMKYEKAEHSEMGMKRGGMTKKYAKGGGIKKFAEGGDDELSLDNMSLSEARNVARNMVEMNGDPSLKHFTWRGQKYAISPSAAPRSAASRSAAAPAAVPMARKFTDQKVDTSKMFPSSRVKEYAGEQDSPASFARQQAAQAAKDKQDRADFEKRFSGALGGANLAALDIAGLGGGVARKAGQAATEAAEAAMRGRNLRSRLTRTMNNDKKMAAENFDRTRNKRVDDYAANFRSKGAPNDADKANRMASELEEMYGRYKKGGSVKRFAKGGSIMSRGDGCASSGRTRGRVI
jgi:hypothetical protein